MCREVAATESAMNVDTFARYYSSELSSTLSAAVVVHDETAVSLIGINERRRRR